MACSRQWGEILCWRTVSRGPIVDVGMCLLRRQNDDGEEGTPAGVYPEFPVEFSYLSYSVRSVELAR
jgi:hypothetical protein